MLADISVMADVPVLFNLAVFAFDFAVRVC